MNIVNRVLTPGLLSLLFIFQSAAPAQWGKKPYTEWSEKEVARMLENSPWSQTQVFTDTSKNFSNANGTTTIADLINVNFRVRFLSAKPVRQAIGRSVELQHKGKLPDQMASQLKAFAAADFPDYIIVTVLCNSDKASNMLQQALSLLQKLKTSELKNNTYLMGKDGERLFLQEYQPPRDDGLGARFVFPRMVNGKPFITPESGEVLFHSELGGGSLLNSTIPNSSNRFNGFTLNTRYKVKDMVFDGKLEY
ncbi:MAG: hypothetical protein ACLGJB_18455 [Blastocatellia bacterium]